MEYTVRVPSIALGLLLLAASSGLKQSQAPIDVERVDREVLAYLTKAKVPGCAVAIVRNGDIVLSKGYGLADLKADLPVTSNTVFRIGSVTKPFTATLVLQLVEQGKVKLDAPISAYVKGLPENVKRITVRQFLGQTSGLANYTALPEFDKLVAQPTTNPKIIALAAKAKTAFPPGKDWQYSNTNYVVLGALIESVTGKSFAEAVRQYAASRKLESTRVFELKPDTKMDRATGYQLEAGKVVKSGPLDPTWPSSAGAIESNLDDLVQWLTGPGGRGLKPETEAMAAEPMFPNDPKKPGYGLGWCIRKNAGLKIVWHNGAIPGFKSIVLTVPERKTAVVVLMNLLEADVDQLGAKILGIAIPELEVKEKVIADIDPEETKFCRDSIEKLLKGELESSQLTPAFAKVLTPDLMKSTQQGLGSLGPITRFDLIESVKDKSSTKRSYLMEIGPVKLTVTIVYVADRKIDGILLRG